MFQLQANPNFKAVLPITRVGDDKPGLIEFEFYNLSRSAVDALEAEANAITKVTAPDGSTRVATDVDRDLHIMRRMIAGWNSEHPEHGVAVAFSVEALRELLDQFPGSAVEIMGGYRRAQMGARQKNA